MALETVSERDARQEELDAAMLQIFAAAGNRGLIPENLVDNDQVKPFFGDSKRLNKTVTSSVTRLTAKKFLRYLAGTKKWAITPEGANEAGKYTSPEAPKDVPPPSNDDDQPPGNPEDVANAGSQDNPDDTENDAAPPNPDDLPPPPANDDDNGWYDTAPDLPGSSSAAPAEIEVRLRGFTITTEIQFEDSDNNTYLAVYGYENDESQQEILLERLPLLADMYVNAYSSVTVGREKLASFLRSQAAFGYTNVSRIVGEESDGRNEDEVKLDRQWFVVIMQKT